MRFNDGLTLFNLLNGDNNDDKNNILKSLYILEVNKGHAIFDCEPYDYAYNTNKMDKTLEKICRVIDKREKVIFKKIQAECGQEVDCLLFTFYDDMSVYAGGTKVIGKNMTINF